jgi:hypothetical protein
MGPAPVKTVPCAKGAICYCLDEFSKAPRAGARIARLRDAIAALAPSYAGLTEVFDQYLLSQVITDAGQRQAIVGHLNAYWFGADTRRPFFPTVPVNRIYAEGVLETLDLSLKGKRPVPINSWWLLDSPAFKMLNLADVEDGVTVSGNVTLLIMTPRPAGRGQATAILGDVAEAYVTERVGRTVSTRRVRDLT